MKSSTKLSDKNKLKESRINWKLSKWGTTLTVIKSSMSPFLFLLVSIVETRRRKSQSEKRSWRKCWLRSKESWKKRWNLCQLDRFLNMSRKIFTIECWKNNKERENRDCKSLDLKLCLKFKFQTDWWDLSQNKFIALSVQNKRNSLLDLCPITVKLKEWTESIERNRKEDKKFLRKSSTNTVIMNFLMEFRKWWIVKTKRWKSKLKELGQHQQPLLVNAPLFQE